MLSAQYDSNVRAHTFGGIKFSDLIPQMEDLFKINVVIYKLKKKVAKLIQKSREMYDETMRLNVYQNH